MSTSDHFSTPVVLTLGGLLTLVQTALVSEGDTAEFISTMSALMHDHDMDIDEMPAIRLLLLHMDQSGLIEDILDDVAESNRLIMGQPSVLPAKRKMVPAKRVARRAPVRK